MCAGVVYQIHRQMLLDHSVSAIVRFVLVFILENFFFLFYFFVECVCIFLIKISTLSILVSNFVNKTKMRVFSKQFVALI